MDIHVDNTSGVGVELVGSSDSDTTCNKFNLKKFVDTASSDTASSASSSVGRRYFPRNRMLVLRFQLHAAARERRHRHHVPCGAQGQKSWFIGTKIAG
ncbi:hypothetical protein AAHA92_08282 [Salvia divinorum]|uniref:Uncharacterized protein n=1 Tax=Salvia divinorum TaxID=28513 RepID=A0ABD1HMS3_SALDI